MKLTISGIGPDKKRKVMTWENGKIEGDEFVKIVYDYIGKKSKSRAANSLNAVSPLPPYSLSMSAFFYVARFILKDVKIIKGSIRRKDYIPSGAKA